MDSASSWVLMAGSPLIDLGPPIHRSFSTMIWVGLSGTPVDIYLIHGGSPASPSRSISCWSLLVSIDFQNPWCWYV